MLTHGADGGLGVARRKDEVEGGRRDAVVRRVRDWVSLNHLVREFMRVCEDGGILVNC